MKNKKETIKIIEILKEFYPDATCSLDFKSPFEMMVSVILAAQCTDERVNKTTPSLFAKFGTPELMAKADLKELEELVHPCGFYKNKAKNLKACSQRILDVFDGKVPENMKDLQSLPGVGRKCANVIMLEAFHNPQGIAVDTHAKRISNRIGFSKQSEPEKVEQDLLKQVPKEYYYDVNHLLVWHGRAICDARKPKCEICPVKEYCDEYNKGEKNAR